MKVVQTLLFYGCQLLLMMIFTLKSMAQSTAISDVSHTPVASAMLDVYSISKGFLVPRMTQAQKTAISTPATGLLIYQTNGSAGFYYYDGSAWVPFITSNTGWLLDGNDVATTNTIGTKTNYDLPVITNNTEKMRITKTGSVGIGTSTFDPINPERLLVDYGLSASSTVAAFKGEIDGYLQINVQNRSDGTNASTDIVATADNGTDSTNYIDMGINGSNYAPGVDNFGGPNDGYLYTNSRHLLIGTQASNSDLIFLVNGGQLSVNQALRIDGVTKNIIVGRKDNSNAPVGNIIRGPNGSGTNIAGGSLSIIAGNATGTATGGALNLNGGTTVSGTGGAVNINVSSNNATNINTGTNNQNITIGGSSNNILLPKFTTVGAIFYTSAVTGQIATTAAGTSGQILVSNGAAAPTWSSGNGTFWGLTGNSGTTAGTNFVGTTDAKDIVFKSNSTEVFRATTSGFVGIGTTTPTQRLETLNGHILINNNNNTSGEIRIAEPSSSGSNYTAVKAQAQAANITYTLPATQGTANSVLINDGTGILSWGKGSVNFIQKPSDETITSSTTLQDDNDFTFALGANQTYEVIGLIKASCGNTGQIKAKFVAPAGSSEFINVFVNRSAADDVSYMTNPTTAYNIATSSVSSTTDVIMIQGVVTTAGTSGTFKLQWTQQNSDATSTVFYANSYLKVTLVK